MEETNVSTTFGPKKMNGTELLDLESKMEKVERTGTSNVLRLLILKYLHRCSPQKSIISCVSPMPPIMLPAIVRRLPTSAKVWNSSGCKAEA